MSKKNVHMSWEDSTVFKDPVLGYISVPKPIVRKIIDHRIFQRLHDVAQTGMEALYPAATHNRFCHSIGVYYLGRLAFEHFHRNVENQYCDTIYRKVAESPEQCGFVWNHWRFLFELACLLHDCGHSPLSHTLEFLYDVTDVSGASVLDGVESNKTLLDFFGRDSDFGKHFLKTKTQEVYGAPHERMSTCLLVRDDGYKNEIEELIKSHDEYLCKKLGIKNEPQYGPDDLKADLEFMVRCIIGYPYSDRVDHLSAFEQEIAFEHENAVSIIYQLRNCIISLLNGKVDVDNIDYSIRDASASGYKSAQVDFERLLKSCTIALAYEHKSLELTDAPFDFAVNLHNFVSTEVQPTAPLKMTIQGRATLRTKEPDEGSATEDSDGLCITGNILEDGETAEKKNVRVIHTNTGSHIHVELKTGRMEIIPRSQDRKEDPDKSGAALYLRSDKLSGCFTGLIFTGTTPPSNTDRHNLWKKITEGNSPRIFPAYHKSALSVIQGALDAANFESQWIYSHHATTYHNNFLSVYLLDKYALYCYAEEKKGFLRDVMRLSSLSTRFQSNMTAKAPVGDDVKELFKRAVSLKEQVMGQITAPGRKDALERFFEKSCPEEMYEDTLKLYKAFLQIFCAIYETSPGSVLNSDDKTGSTETARQNALDSDVEKAFAETARQLVLLDQEDRLTPEPLLEVDKQDIQDLLNRFNNPDKKRLHGGMPVMRDLLGMPDIKKVNGKRYFRSSDADLRSAYHDFLNNADEKQKQQYKELFDAIVQYESRDYLSAMWKSHAEFQFYVHGWKPSWLLQPEGENGKAEKTLVQRFFDNANAPRASKDPNDVLYTFFSENEGEKHNDKLKAFWDTCKGTYNLETLVYVPQSIRHKELDCSRTYVIWKDRVVSLQDIGFQINQGSKINFFYFYYRLKGNKKTLDIAQFMDFLRETLEKFERESENIKPSLIL